MKSRCPRCGSRDPVMHPAVQFEGEVEICIDDFHLTPTNATSSPGSIAQVLAKRARLSKDATK